jgi:hypothetical protein
MKRALPLAAAAGMKRALPLLLAATAGCAGGRTECFDDCRPGAAAPDAVTSAPALRKSDRANIDAVLDDWHDAAARADEARYFAHFAPDGVFLGTDAGERWDVAAFRAFAHPYFAKGTAWTLRPSNRHVAVAACSSAWAATGRSRNTTSR